MYPRSEFPIEKIAPLIDAKGRVNKRAAKMRFSLCGKPHADPGLLAYLIKAGHRLDIAFQLTILASDCNTHGQPMVDCVAESTRRVLDVAKGVAIELHPHSKWAEERAALMERRPSRWGTAEFHRGTEESTRTEHYPFRRAES